MVDRRLGRGLEYFLSSVSPADTEADQEALDNAKAARRARAAHGPSDDSSAVVAAELSESEAVRELSLSELEPNPFQPRTDFDPVDLQNLAASLRNSGVLQPILVRKGGAKFQIIAGERRWRAAKLAGLERIPAIVREITDESAAVLALVENVQRADLNAIEKAKAFRRIQEMTQSSQRDLAKQVGLERSTVANMLRLLDLPEEVQVHVSRGTLSMGHARALLGLGDGDEQKTVAEKIIKDRMNVRQVEAFIQSLNDATSMKDGDGKATRTGGSRPVWLNELEENLCQSLDAKVGIRYGRKKSKITIECGAREDFERVYELLKGLGRGDDLD